MSALSAGRRTLRRNGDRVSHPLAAGAAVFGGGLVCLDASGWLVPGTAAPGLTCVGVAAETVGNPGGAAGAVHAEVDRHGAWRFDSDATDPVGRTRIGKLAYMVDDHTLAATAGNDGGGNPARSAAGTVIDIDADGVWIVF